MEKIAQPRGLGAARGLPRHEPIQGQLMTNDAKNQFLTQPRVRVSQPILVQSGLEQVFDELAPSPALQDLERNFSWFLDAHNL